MSLAPIAPLVGEKVYLAPLGEDDVTDDYVRWLNDPEVTRYLEVGRVRSTRESVQRYVEKFTHSASDLLLAIRQVGTNQHLGNVTLNNIDWTVRTGHLGVLIGRKEWWGTGYALEALRLLITYAFQELKLHKVTAGAVIDNVPSIIMLKKLGFKTEGVFRQEKLVEGVYRDVVRLGLLREEFLPMPSLTTSLANVVG